MDWQVVLLAIIAGICAALPPTVAAWRTGNISKEIGAEAKDSLAITTEATATKLDTIHVLVNSRLTEALAKIDRLEAKLYETTGEPPTGEPPPAT